MIPGFARTSTSRRCPVCGKPDWCLVSVDGSRAICQRVESARRWKEAGWLHVLDSTAAAPVHVRPARDDRPIDLRPLAEVYARANHGGLERHAAMLGLDVGALRRMGAGYKDDSDALVIPMRDWLGTVVGLRFRGADGSKWSARGSRQGLFFDPGMAGSGPLVFCEGATDAAALIGLGLAAVGRPSCSGGDGHAVAIQRRLGWPCVVLADTDAVGRAGARRLASALGCPWAVPPAKDARAWVAAGATRADVLTLAEAGAVV